MLIRGGLSVMGRERLLGPGMAKGGARGLWTGGGGGRFRRMVERRYPGLTGAEAARLTAAFVVLHELTALVPLVGLFGLVHASGSADFLLRHLRALALPDPADNPNNNDPQPQPGFLASSLHAASDKVHRIARRYGYADHSPNSTLAVDSGIIASGLVAYLSVKLLLPLRISLSLYLSPSLARLFRSLVRFRRPSSTKPPSPS